jgi:hypothetical protein
MKNFELTDDEAQALVRVIREAIDSDRFPLSPRVQVLRAILARLKPEPARPAASPEPRVYEPPSGVGTGDEAQWKAEKTPCNFLEPDAF